MQTVLSPGKPCGGVEVRQLMPRLPTLLLPLHSLLQAARTLF